MDKQLLKRYRQVKKKLADWKQEEDQLKDQIIDGLNEEGVDKLESNWGTFTVAIRKSYEYSDEVKKLEEKVKLAKVKEEQKGIAKEKVSTYLRFTDN